MATLEQVSYIQQEVTVDQDGVNFMPKPVSRQKGCKPRLIKAMPVLYWSNGSLWNEANLWLCHRASLIYSGELKPSTVHAYGWKLLPYAKWLDSEKLDWFALDVRRADRPTVRYRGHLISLRGSGRIKPSTASSRMRVVLQFYRWLMDQGLLAANAVPFERREIQITYENQFGFTKSKPVSTSDLAITYRRPGKSILEDGLHPVSREFQTRIMAAATDYSSEEFQLMLALGFATGMRIQSILDLKLATIECSLPSATGNGRYLQIGPQHNVSTKNEVNGNVFIPLNLLQHLIGYAYSPRRLKREASASAEDRLLLFLNRNGKRYADRGADKSSSINQDICRLRKIAKRTSLDMRGFYFHCTRATFATNVVTAGLRTNGQTLESVLCAVRDLLLHKDESTSLRYIKYVEGEKIKSDYENAYGEWIFGKKRDTKIGRA